jgi:hypothetical protein
MDIVDLVLTSLFILSIVNTIVTTIIIKKIKKALKGLNIKPSGRGN